MDWPSCGARVWIGVLLAALYAPAADFELIGQLQPQQALPVHLQGATTPFSATTEANLNGRFHFRKLPAGAYVLFVGALQRTVEVGPSLADSKGRISVAISLSGADLESNDSGRVLVSVRELSISREAEHEYTAAEEALGRPDVAAAVSHLKKAVGLAPQFSAAWNHLGTIAYQTGLYAEAETDFRKGLEADPEAYAPLVNLGGVLLNLGRWSEALEYNLLAVRRSPATPWLTRNSACRTSMPASSMRPRNISRPPSKSIRRISRIRNCCWPRSTCAGTSGKPQRMNCRI